jgi:hypothetical protein
LEALARVDAAKVQLVELRYFLGCTAEETAEIAQTSMANSSSSAVQFAHQNLIVHRDLSPDNILSATDGTPRLLDFGTVKLLQPETSPGAGGFTQHGLPAFNPNYASPEQILGEPISTAIDMYPLGVFLYLRGRTSALHAEDAVPGWNHPREVRAAGLSGAPGGIGTEPWGESDSLPWGLRTDSRHVSMGWAKLLKRVFGELRRLLRRPAAL